MPPLRLRRWRSGHDAPGLAELDRVTVEGRGYIDTPANGRRLVIGSCTLARSAGDPSPQ
jgi:hypothetical protein